MEPKLYKYNIIYVQYHRGYSVVYVIIILVDYRASYGHLLSLDSIINFMLSKNPVQNKISSA